MKSLRLASLTVAIVLTAIQWGALLEPTMGAQALRATGTQTMRAGEAVAPHALWTPEMPMVVVTGHRQSRRHQPA